MNILITAGGTQEKIDQVRSITNTSTGKTSLGIAQFLFDHGHRNIFYVHAQKSPSFPQALENIQYVTSDDLDKALKTILGTQNIDVIIHASAVSDFVVDKVVINGELFEPSNLNKISSLDEVELILKRRSKIIENLKSYSKSPHPLVIGFKLTNTREPTEQQAQVFKLSMSENVDFVVHNDLHAIKNSEHKTQIYFKDQLMFKGETKEDLYENIWKILELYAFNKNVSLGQQGELQ